MDQPPPVLPDSAGLRSPEERLSSYPIKHALLEPSKTSVLPLGDIVQMLNSSLAGLSASEAAAISEVVGPNQIEAAKPKRLLIAFLERFGNPLVMILLCAAAVSAFTGDLASFVIIAVIVLMSVILDMTQEYQAQKAADRLRAQVSLTAKALRDGEPVEIAATDIVPGDIILFAAGDLVPADSRLVEARDLYVDEALLTGEAYPAEKELASASATTVPDTAFPRNLLFMGSSVVSGTGRALVVATGRAIELGSIAGGLRKPPPPTAFALSIQNFGMMIVKATVFLVLFVVLINLLFHRPLIESFLFALALAVGLTPELLPMIVSVTLAHGGLRMAQKQVIVKRQSAINDLDSMDVFCSDKTGTLTEAHIQLVREVDLGGRDSSDVMELAQLNAAFETGLKSPLDEAILAAGKADLSNWRKIDEVPFDFERRRVSVLVEGGSRRLIVVKGAPEDVLRLAAYYDAEGAPSRPLEAEARKMAEATFNRLSAEGYRLLGVAWREVEADRQHASVADEADLTFAGFLAFLDPPKTGAREALTALADLGVAVKVVTGDNELVTRHVCGELGLEITGTLTGPEVAELTDEALSARVDDTTLFCRVTPPQKSRVISALRHKGHVVGYLGDGINDAPPLHAADVGFSVDTAVDVAKEAAAMILLRKDLSVLADGVREGRRTFANILKYMMMGTSSNFGNMFSMAAGVLFLPFLPMLPTQILLNNLLYDLSETTIPLDRVSDATVARPCRWDLDTVRKFMFVFGPLSSVFDFVTFGLLLWVFSADQALFQTGWFVESLSTQILVIFLIRTPHPLQDRPHPALVASTLGAFVVAVTLPYSPLAHWLGFVPLPATVLGAFLLVTAIYLGAVHGVRRWLRIARVRILDTLVGRLAEDPGRALPYARTLVRIEVAEEAFRARLVSLLGRCGRRDEAQRQYDIGRRLLTKLGVPATGVLEAAWHALTAPTAARPPDPAARDHGADGIAEPGGISISEDAFRQVRGKIETEFRDSGEPAQKNIARRVCVYRARPASAPASAIPAATTLPQPDKPSIAVLPFQNMSSDPEQEYFVDGMVEEIIAALSRIRWLFVLARNSSFTYKGQAVDVKQVGRELGVRYVLEGSVRKSGNRVRITGQLIDAATRAHLWADRFDGSLEDVFGLQDKVASSVVGVIEPALQVAETARSASRSTNDLTAYDLYLRGYAMSLSSAKQIPEVLCLMEQAIARDPRYGPALAWAALCHMRRVFDDRSEDREADRLKGADFARRALEVAGDDPGILANAALALAYFGEDIGAMMELVDRALSLNPSFARGWYVSGVLRNWAGQPDIAIEHLELSLRLSPRARIGLSLLNIGYAHFFSRRFAEALPKLILAIQADPSDPRGYRFLAACYAHMGRLDDAREILKQLRAITPVVIPDASFLRNAEHRELFLSGLRLATGDAT